MLEFTGERVIPCLVDPNLFNEHRARYRFAARFADGRSVLDADCGSGYGTAELANAMAHARRAFAGSGVHFLHGACESLPFADESFLRPTGVLLVSTPNKASYAERTDWPQTPDAELQRLRAELQALERAKLVRLGRKLQLIPGKPE